MKTLILVIFVMVAFSCSEKVEEVPISNLSDYNMKIIPENPNSNDLIQLVIYDDCSYNVLSEIRKSGNAIRIRKQYNSMMKLPCVIKNDTVAVGVFPAGEYRVNYQLLDTSTEISDPVTISFYFMLTISKQ